MSIIFVILVKCCLMITVAPISIGMQQLSYRTANWHVGVQTRDFQSITQGLGDQYSLLPKISVDGNYRLFNTLAIDLKHEHAVFDHKNAEFTTGSRNRLDYSIHWDQQWNWGFFKPNISFKHLSYDLNSPLDTKLIQS